MDKNEVLIVATNLAQSIDTVMDGLHSCLAAWEHPTHFIYAELVGISLQHRLPTTQTNYCNSVNIGVALETHHSVNDDGTTINVHKLLGNILSHSVAGSSGDY